MRIKDAPITILPTRLTDTSGAVTHRTGFGLPAYLEEKACKRVAQFALIMVVLLVIISVVSPAIWHQGTASGHKIIVRVTQGIALLLSVALFLVARSHRLSHTAVLNLGLVYEFLFCLFFSVGYNWFTASAYNVFAAITLPTIVIAVYPLIVPSPPRRTLVVALASAATAPLSIFVVSLLGVTPPSAEDYLGVSTYPAAAIVLALFGSRIVYGLSTDVARARELGSYQLKRLLGKGGMGEVWAARHRLLARPAAVKVVRSDAVSGNRPDRGAHLLERFEREAQVTASLKSPHTVQLYDFGTTDDGSFYYVMELLDGLDLDTLVGQFGPIQPERAIYILSQACCSLAEAHDANLAHRDIKPANIMVCRYGCEFDFVKVLDFGLVALGPKEQVADKKLTVEGMVSGTPEVMPPEMITNGVADSRGDIYSLGCVAYWLLTGRTVFEADTPMAMVLAHAKDTPRPPSRVTEFEIPGELDRIVLACLDKDPSKRPQTADELMERLDACALENRWTKVSARKWWETHRPQTAVGLDPGGE